MSKNQQSKVGEQQSQCQPQSAEKNSSSNKVQPARPEDTTYVSSPPPEVGVGGFKPPIVRAQCIAPQQCIAPLPSFDVYP